MYMHSYCIPCVTETARQDDGLAEPIERVDRIEAPYASISALESSRFTAAGHGQRNQRRGLCTGEPPILS